MIPQIYVIWLGVDKVASYTSLCLLNLRASIDFHWERKKTVNEKLNTQTAPHLHLLFLLSASQGGCRGQWMNWKSPNPPPACLHVTECCCWSWLGSFKFLLCRLESNLKNQNAPVGTFSWRKMLTLCRDRCENVMFLRQLKLKVKNWTLLLCYTTSRVCSSTGTKSTCSLARHLHLNEYDTDCLLSVCARVWIFTFTIHLLATKSGFSCSCLCGTGADFCHPSEFDLLDFVQSRKHCVCTVF